MKRCYKCKNLLDLDMFHNDKSKSQGRAGICKSCICNRNKLWYNTNKDELLYKNKLYRENHRYLVLTHYSGTLPKCMCPGGCNETFIEFLAVDHINNDGAEHGRKINHKEICRWLVLNNFPEGFRILCHNCNSARQYCGSCPHERNKFLKMEPFEDSSYSDDEDDEDE